MKSLSERLATAEADLRKLHEEARDLGLTLNEIKKLSQEEEVEQIPVIKKAEPTPPPLPPKLPQPEPEEPAPVFQQDAGIPSAEEPLAASPTLPAYSSNFEMQLGRVWFVRIGILLLTTGLVFLSSYTYKNYIQDLGPGIRLALLYLFTGGLTAVGLFCEQWKESLKNYGRIVAAGGLAALYYTSYAAHNVEALKVIDSPVIGSLLLIATALFCGGVALWKDSKLMLGTSLALAFYAVMLNPLGWMVGLSALLLSVGGSFIARRQKWTELHYIGVVGSYFSYAWWAFTTQSFTPGMEWFLVPFWVVFVGLTIIEKIPEHRIFCSINHGAFFLLFSIDPHTRSWITGQWLFALILGTAILAIGILARYRFNRFPKDSFLLHLIKGLGLITLGIMLKLSGHQLFLTLLLESVILIGIHLKIPNRFLPIASYTVAGISVMAYLDRTPYLPTYAWLIAAILWAGFALLHRKSEGGLSKDQGWVPSIIGFGMMFLVLVLGAFQNVDSWKTMLLLGGTGVVTSFLHLRKVQLKLLFDFYWVSTATSSIALLALIFTEDHAGLLVTGSVMAFLLHVVHGLGLRDTEHPIETQARSFLAVFYFTLGVAFITVAIHFGIAETSHRMLLYLTVPLLGTLLASKTRQSIHSSIPFLIHLVLLDTFVFESVPVLLGLLILVAHLIVLRNFHGLEDQKLLEVLTFVLTSGFWFSQVLCSHSLGLSNVIILTWSSVGILLLGKYYQRSLVTICAIPFYFYGLGIGLAVSIEPETSMIPVYIGLLAPLLLHLISSKKGLVPKHQIVGVISLAILWLAVTEDVGSSGRAASWAVLGTISLLIGLFTKSRAFRITALVILATTLGHVMIIDIVKLDPLPRILSFITLGLGLLGLGFVYNRWQEKLKQIL
ncbi:DUF2339 domain-containing protein [Akkermansiaceae bacterium]|nr:DUF2339 domain-containing protein [Akkermansiaceae bacterium]MDB4421482.1 DUF2339 domain-containing protein [Akkermansiaceae bacterium]MDB4546226.1 DUF2339 domain-containing protein [Akkermansiaceae bacterium]